MPPSSDNKLPIIVSIKITLVEPNAGSRLERHRRFAGIGRFDSLLPLPMWADAQCSQRAELRRALAYAAPARLPRQVNELQWIRMSNSPGVDLARTDGWMLRRHLAGDEIDDERAALLKAFRHIGVAARELAEGLLDLGKPLSQAFPIVAAAA